MFILFSFTLLFSFSLVSAVTWTTDTQYKNTNRSDFWDNLDTPADISTADLTDDNTYVQVAGDTMTGALTNEVGITIGDGSATDFSYKADASANDGELTWDEDRQSWRFGSALSTDKVGIGETTTADTRLWINTENTDPTAARYGFWVRARKTTSSTDANHIYGFLGQIQTFGTGDHTGISFGMSPSVVQVGSGTVAQARGVSSSVTNFDGVAGTITTARPFYAVIDAEDGTITNGYGYYAATPLVDTGNITNFYNFYSQTITGVDGELYSWYAEDGDMAIDEDNAKFYFGEGQDASIYYNGTNLEINPKEVGSGVVKILGGLSLESTDITEGANFNIYSGLLGFNVAVDNAVTFQPDNDINDYLKIDTTSNDLTLEKIGSGKFIIKSGSGEIDFDNENLTTTGNITASYFFGDGSQLTGISGGIWENVSGVAVYNVNANVTSNFSVGELYKINDVPVLSTKGTNNIMVGDAGKGQTGTEGIFIGKDAGDANTGQYATCIGYESCSDAMTGDNNAGIGYNTLTAVTSGYSNTAIGSYVGDAINTGYQNTLIADRAGSALTTGFRNTAIGP